MVRKRLIIDIGDCICNIQAIWTFAVPCHDSFEDCQSCKMLQHFANKVNCLSSKESQNVLEKLLGPLDNIEDVVEGGEAWWGWVYSALKRASVDDTHPYDSDQEGDPGSGNVVE